MIMGDFELAYAFTMKLEGGYSNSPHDKGGQTNFGITTRTFMKAKASGYIDKSLNTVKDLTSEDAKIIYQNMY